MKAVVYQGPFSVSVENVPDPELQHPNDVIVKITSSCICGSDLHMYEGRTAAEPGIIFGHENMGIVEEVGSAVKTLNAGDRVVMPFNVACGFCKNCQRGFTGFCTIVNPGFAGGAYGYVAMGPWRRRAGRVPASTPRRLQLPAPSCWRRVRVRLRDARRHIPHRLSRRRTCSGQPRRERRRLRLRPRRTDGSL